MKHFYSLEPTAPLVFRSGRPFGTGSQESARFPWPSALAGALRTAWMRAQGDVGFTRAEEALQHAVGGPLLLAPDGEVYVPKPADAVVVLDEQRGRPTVHRLMPGNYPKGVGSNLPEGLQPVVAQTEFVGKPQKVASFWPISAILAWDAERTPIPETLLQGDGEPAPLRLRRHSTHLRLDRRRHAAESGQIFQLEALDFGRERLADRGFADGVWRLAVFYEQSLPQGLVQLGGERRGAWVEPEAAACPVLPEYLARALQDSDTFALTLCTPAIFSHGWRPAWLDEQLQGEIPGIPGLRVRLQSLANERWQGVSGWDLALQQPKPARRAVPAGSTYWFRILEKPADTQWVAQLWFHAISDALQDRRDGWGLVLPRLAPFSSAHTPQGLPS